MSEVTRILSAIEAGDPSAAEQLLPLVYDELRRLAARKLSQEKPGQTLQATALAKVVAIVDLNNNTYHYDTLGTWTLPCSEHRAAPPRGAQRKAAGEDTRSFPRRFRVAESVVPGES